MSGLGWVDFSDDDRNMLFRMLAEEGTVDELGTGTIRDGFSDILFPGTSTQHTLAKYFFLIPYICLELESRNKGRKLEQSDFIKALEREEVNLSKILALEGEKGVIGLRSIEKLKRKPSSLYWNALRKYGFFTQDLSRAGYARKFCGNQKKTEYWEVGGKRDADDVMGDSDRRMIEMEGHVFWDCNIPNKDWRNNITTKLTPDEAEYLRERIILTRKESGRDNLLAFVLESDWREFVDLDGFEDIAAMQHLMPIGLWDKYKLALDFSRFFFGAQVRYNVIYSRFRELKDWEAAALSQWQQYINKREERPKVDLEMIWKCLGWKPKQRVMGFLESFQKIVGEEKEINEGKLDKIIRDHEIYTKKGETRAKLTNKKLELEKGYINMTRLSYRFENAKKIASDIFEGMGSLNA